MYTVTTLETNQQNVGLETMTKSGKKKELEMI